MKKDSFFNLKINFKIVLLKKTSRNLLDFFNCLLFVQILFYFFFRLFFPTSFRFNWPFLASQGRNFVILLFFLPANINL